MNLHLVSSRSGDHYENTRAVFENYIPNGDQLTYNRLALKDIFFTARFCNVDKQNRPHILIICDRLLQHAQFGDEVGVDRAEPGSLSGYVTLQTSPDTMLGSHMILRTITYNFGKMTIIEDNAVTSLIITFNPVRLESTKTISSLLNFLIDECKLSSQIQFYSTAQDNMIDGDDDEETKLVMRSAFAMVMIDKDFCKFLGFSFSDNIASDQLFQNLNFTSPVLEASIVSLPLPNYTFLCGDDKTVSGIRRGLTSTTQQTAQHKPYFSIFEPTNILVLCEVVKPQIFQSRLLSYIGVIKPHTSKHQLKNYHSYGDGGNALVHYQPITPIELPVKRDRNKTLKISLVDSHFQKLRLTTASPTLISLQVNSMHLQREPQIIFSSSADIVSLSHHPTNTAGRFTHQLPKDLEIDRANDGVELLSVTVSSKIFNLSAPYNQVLVVHEYDNTGAIFKEGLPPCCRSQFLTGGNSITTKQAHTITLTAGHYPDIKAVATRAHLVFNHHGIDFILRDGVIFLQNLWPDAHTTLTMRTPLAVILGLSESDEDEDFVIDLHTAVGGFYTPKLDLLYPDYILLYAENFVENSVVGGLQIPLLKIISAPQFLSARVNTHFDFNSSNLVKFSKPAISQLCFTLRDITGRILQFDDGSVTECQLRISSFK